MFSLGDSLFFFLTQLLQGITESSAGHISEIQAKMLTDDWKVVINNVILHMSILTDIHIGYTGTGQ